MALKEICDIFSIFHDGDPEDWTLEKASLNLKVACTYLAEKISPEYEYFQIQISGVKTFRYIPWGHPEGYDGAENLDRIKKCDFEIGTAKIENGLVHVICHEHQEIFDSPGGEFILNGTEIHLFDEAGNSISLKKLKEISREHWDQLGK